ncbi:MAG: excinuclease ABC subunit UvrB [Candidatus Aminicenantes bacterium]|nr:excinuclease ABC subunit UvrB [Candidatus Aminicenantes bacterium]
MQFKIISDFLPKGSQPGAIKALTSGLKKNYNFQTLLGVTGSGKTYTVAKVIENTGKPTLVIAHNKTLAAQLYNEFSEFFPQNRVEYFVSYYDYYQPESYIPQRDQYIEKDTLVNPKIEQMRLAAAASLASGKDVIVVATVSCIYSVGNPKDYMGMGFELSVGQEISRKEIMRNLIRSQYERNELELMPGRFRVKGDTIDFIPGYYNNIIRIEMFGDEIERLLEIDKITGKPKEELKYLYIYPARHFVIPEETMGRAVERIKEDLDKRLSQLDMVEAHRLKQRTLYDIEMIEETGFCKGIENYSIYFDGREIGERPYCLLDYFGDDFLIVIDESHQTIPQLHGMYRGDYSRKKNLVDYGFRLPTALDNRPLKFSEFEGFMKKQQAIFTSATPGPYEWEVSTAIVEQIIRPTGLIDPQVFTRPIKGQVEDLVREINSTIKQGDRVLVTTLTKRLAEELTEYLAEKNIKTRYLHSDIDTLERTEIIRQLRLGEFNVLVGINLLREGLDIPEVGFIGILDADKEGFLRDARSLIQIIGRAARNINSKVVMYADRLTDSMKQALTETERRRKLQLAYNEKHNIVPETIKKAIKEKVVDVKDTKHIPKKNIPGMIIETEMEMRKAADRLDFEEAIRLREQLKKLQLRVRQ